MLFKKILWTLKRHPFLYTTRFKLLSRNTSVDKIDECSYNNSNDKKEIPEIFSKINQEIFKNGFPTSDFDKVKAISIWLLTNIKGGPGLSEPSDRALEIMLAGKGGVCSDMAQIFNNFCMVNDIKVREWGSTRLPFDKDFGGHSFNEVFCKDLNKWVLIDVYYCVLFYNDESTPLSVVEFYSKLRSGKKVNFKTFYDGRVLEESSIENNFLNPTSAPFLVCNYSNKIYDTYLRLTKPYMPVFLTHFILYIFNKSYHYRFPLDNYKKLFS